MSLRMYWRVGIPTRTVNVQMDCLLPASLVDLPSGDFSWAGFEWFSHHLPSPMLLGDGSSVPGMSSFFVGVPLEDSCALRVIPVVTR